MPGMTISAIPCVAISASLRSTLLPFEVAHSGRLPCRLQHLQFHIVLTEVSGTARCCGYDPRSKSMRRAQVSLNSIAPVRLPGSATRIPTSSDPIDLFGGAVKIIPTSSRNLLLPAATVTLVVGNWHVRLHGPRDRQTSGSGARSAAISRHRDDRTSLASFPHRHEVRTPSAIDISVGPSSADIAASGKSSDRPDRRSPFNRWGRSSLRAPMRQARGYTR